MVLDAISGGEPLCDVIPDAVQDVRPSVPVRELDLSRSAALQAPPDDGKSWMWQNGGVPTGFHVLLMTDRVSAYPSSDGCLENRIVAQKNANRPHHHLCNT